MSVHVFLGPSLAVAEAESHLSDATFHPPVAMGDVQNLMHARTRPTAIAIIDGFFKLRPAVWHKELLYAISEGVAVYGASSMGALRAAELHTFGMIGVGKIFEAFRDGVLEADDEVAVAHATAEHGFRPLSDPMVNIREGLRRAEADRLIGRATHDHLLAEAQREYFASRSWGRLFERAHEVVPSTEIAALKEFVRAIRPDLKREDAVSLLERVARDRAAGFSPPPPSFDFEPTPFWHRIVSTALRAQASAEGGAAGPRMAAVLSHASITSGCTTDLRRLALLRHLVLMDAHRLRIPDPAPSQVARVAERFRRELGLETAQATRDWMARNQLDAAEFTRLMAFEHTIDALERHYSVEVSASIPAVLKVRNLFSTLAERVMEQEAFYESRAMHDVSMTEAGIDLSALYRWYAERYSPFHTTPEEHALRLGFSSLHAFHGELTRLYYFERERTIRRDKGSDERNSTRMR